MYLGTYLIICLLLSLCQSHTDKRLKNPRMFALITESPSAGESKKLAETPVSIRNNSSKLFTVPIASGHGVNLTASSTPPGTCQGQNQSCDSSEAIRSRVREENLRLLSEECVLWNDTCSGNITRGTDIFFNGSIFFTARDCFLGLSFKDPVNGCDDPGGIEQLSKLRSWMSSPQCLSTASSWKQNHPYNMLEALTNWDTCCGTFKITGRTVDIFYWPDSNADDSCLSIIEDTAHPLDMGATLDTKWYDGVMSKNYTIMTYWGCTTKAPTSGQSIITTAFLSTYSALTLKVPRANPWDPPDCISVSEQYVTRLSANTTMRLHSIYQIQNSSDKAQPPITQFDKESVATAVSDGYTFISPSIYARFHNAVIGDQCGVLTLSDTMFNFAPGELSTIVAPMDYFENGFRPEGLITRAFDPADLPCPPQSIMEGAWYTPEPQVPYRPLVAFPEKIKSILSYSSFPANFQLYFMAIDPPYALSTQNTIINGNRRNGTPAKPGVSITPDALTSASNDLVPSLSATPAPRPDLDKGVKQTSAPNQDAFKPQKAGLDAPRKSESSNNVYRSSSGPESKGPGQHTSEKDAQYPSKSLTIGPSSVQTSPSGIQIKSLPVSPDSLTASLTGGSSAIIDKTSRNIEVGDKIYQISPESPVTTAEGVLQTFVTISLPNSAKAVLLLSTTHESRDPADVNAGNGNNQGQNEIDTDEVQGTGLLVSVFGTTLTPDGAPVTLTIGSAPGHGAPLTLSLDSNNNIIYNPTVHTLSTMPPSQTQPGATNPNPNPNNPPVGPITTRLPGHQPILVPPNGEGMYIAGTTLYLSSSLSGSLTVVGGKEAEMSLSGTRFFLLGTSALVIGGITTVTLPIPAPAATQGVGTGAVRKDGNVSNTDSSSTRMSQGTEVFTGAASSTISPLRRLRCGLLTTFLTTIVLSFGL